MSQPPRVAFLTDTYHEVNGVALTSRQLQGYASRHNLPFLCVYGGSETYLDQRGSVTHLQLERGPLAFALDKGLHHDPALWRYQGLVMENIRKFQPDLLHLTSPGDVGQMGAVLAHTMKIPLVISWHTNFHEFGARRLHRMLRGLPNRLRDGISDLSEHHILRIMLTFYKLGRVLFAPNEELVAMLSTQTGRPTFLMKRGIDTALFSPCRRTVNDGISRIGYVGRITPEKNVTLLARLEHALIEAGYQNFRFLIVGDGSERESLQKHMKFADFPGVVRGEALAQAFANMDIFAFPSRTDTFGNVVLEALASGTPAVVTNGGGPKFIIEEGVSGFSAADEPDFIQRVRQLMDDRELLQRMSADARRHASQSSWDMVFDEVYIGYRVALK